MKRPVLLTVKKKAAAVVQDATAYQRLLDIPTHADVEEGIRQAWPTLRTRPAREAFDSILRKRDVPR